MALLLTPRLALLTLALCAVAGEPRAAQAGRRGRDALSGPSSALLAAFRSSARDDDRLHASAVRSLVADLRAGRKEPDEAFVVHASALAYLSEKLDRAADAASAGFVEAARVAMSGDPSLPGAAPGDGGSADRFADGIRGELERVRRRADARVRGFRRTFLGKLGAHGGMTASLPQWTFDLRSAPRPAGALEAGDEPPRIRTLTAARLDDGRVLFAASGTAGPGYAHAFDLRLRGDAFDLVGDDLSQGGLDVSDDGAWSVSVEMGDPFQATTPLPGNRVVLFGMEPYDAGLAGMQPARLVRAAVFGLP